MCYTGKISDFTINRDHSYRKYGVDILPAPVYNYKRLLCQQSLTYFSIIKHTSCIKVRFW